MIRIECLKKDGKIIFLSLKGHANTASYGQDIVCSAVSAVAFGGLNALENPSSFTIKSNEEKGELEIEAHSSVTNHDYIVLETMLIQFKSIEESAPKNVRIIEKGC